MPDLQIPILESASLRLEPISQAHAAGMFELFSDAKVCEHSGPAVDSTGLQIPLPAESRAESDRLLEFWVDRARAGTGFRWAVKSREQGEFVGAVGFNSLGLCSEYAYHFIPRFWGRGLATEASWLALAWSFARGATFIESFIEARNAESIRLAVRLGFELCNESPSEVSRYTVARITDEVTFRLATRLDVDPVSAVYLASRKTFLPYAPLAHSDEAVRHWIGDELIPAGSVTLAYQRSSPERLLGMMVLEREGGVGWIEHLYLHPFAVGEGLGTSFIARAKLELGSPIRLHTFQANEGARRFYERLGFRALEFGDGSGNEERCPDILFEWV